VPIVAIAMGVLLVISRLRGASSPVVRPTPEQLALLRERARLEEAEGLRVPPLFPGSGAK